MLDTFINFFVNYGYFAVFGLLLLCGFGFPLPEDITLTAGGFIASIACDSESSFLPALHECHQIHWMFLISMAGVLIGDCTMYLIGRKYGTHIMEMRFFSKLITPSRYQWICDKFEKYGLLVIFSGRFLPGLRSPIFVATGVTKKVSFLKFIFIDGIAAVISVPFWVYLGFWGQRQLNDIKDLEKYIQKGQLSFILFALVIFLTSVVVWYIKKKIKEKTHFQ